MPFGDAGTVIADRSKQGWKLVTGTLALNPAHTTTVAYQYLYVWPNPDTSGIGGSGYPVSGDMITAYREGETYPPKSDDTWTLADGTAYLISKVTSRLNADEAMGYAVYDCVVTRITNV